MKCDKSIHGNDLTRDLANEKFTIVVEIVFFNGIHIIVPRTAPKIRFSLLNGKHQHMGSCRVSQTLFPLHSESGKIETDEYQHSDECTTYSFRRDRIEKI